nr:hypothetical protein [Accumulibacter sp.]
MPQDLFVPEVRHVAGPGDEAVVAVEALRFELSEGRDEFAVGAAELPLEPLRLAGTRAVHAPPQGFGRGLAVGLNRRRESERRAPVQRIAVDTEHAARCRIAGLEIWGVHEHRHFLAVEEDLESRVVKHDPIHRQEPSQVRCSQV